MKCPVCSADIPDRDLVCGECGAYVYRDVPAVSREVLQSDTTEHSPPPPLPAPPRPPASQPRTPAAPYPTGEGGPDFVYPTLHGWPGLPPNENVSETALLDESMVGTASGGALPTSDSVFAALGAAEAERRGRTIGRWSVGLALLAILLPIAGLIGFATGVMAWRLGETRLGRLGVVLSIVLTLAGVTLGILLTPTG